MILTSPTLLRTLTIWFLINSAIAFGHVLIKGYGIYDSMVYSQCIGFSICALMGVGRRVFITDRANQWFRGLLIIIVSTILGTIMGYRVADLFTGYGMFNALIGSSANVATNLLFSLAVAAVVTYVFVSRERMQQARETLIKAQAEAETARRHAAEAHLKLLETQLEPHMLFNTLANLRILIGMDTARAQDMLDHLIAYLRATLGASRATSHPLQTEFDRLRDYLALMQVRMGPRLTFQLHLPDELTAVDIPPLLLQALVENSIKHGLEPQIEGGKIEVTASRAGQHLVLTVADTGVGLASTVAPANAAPDSGFGVDQVRERLQASYGAVAHFTLTPNVPQGTVATITLPLSL